MAKQKKARSGQKFLQFSKFSPVTIEVKERLREIRLEADLDMNQASAMLGISRKQLEDIEAIRNYGCHLDLEILCKMSVVYDVPVGELIEPLPVDALGDHYRRPRLRKGSSKK